MREPLETDFYRKELDKAKAVIFSMFYNMDRDLTLAQRDQIMVECAKDWCFLMTAKSKRSVRFEVRTFAEMFNKAIEDLT